VDKPGAVDDVKRSHMICVALELLRFVAWIIMLAAR